MKIVISQRVRSRSLKIIKRIYENFSDKVADKVSLAIENKLQKIAENPFIGSLDINKKGQIIRKAVVRDKTVITYEIDEAAQTVYILDIVDGRTDWKG